MCSHVGVCVYAQVGVCVCLCTCRGVCACVYAHVGMWMCMHAGPAPGLGTSGAGEGQVPADPRGPASPCTGTARWSCCSRDRSLCRRHSGTGRTRGSPTSPWGTGGRSCRKQAEGAEGGLGAQACWGPEPPLEGPPSPACLPPWSPTLRASSLIPAWGARGGRSYDRAHF